MNGNQITRHRYSIIPLVFIVLLSGVIVPSASSTTLSDPGNRGPCEFEKLSLDINGIETVFYIPVTDTCGTWTTAPFPGLVFAHGFTMFGFTDGVADVDGNGEHLASWGYVVAIPSLPDEAEPRITDVREVLDAMQELTNQSGSVLYQIIDPDSLAVVGYSLGGSTALATAARDDRIDVIVALDPVYHEGGFGGEGPPIWHPENEGENIDMPTGILGSPPSDCNAAADFEDIFDYVGATHKASYLISEASHCDFLDPGNSFCSFFCTGTTSPAHTRLSQRYMTSWFNYYLLLRPEFYNNLFGPELAQDVGSGAIEPVIFTQVKGLHGASFGNSAILTWAIYHQPILAGYNVYRRDFGGEYPSQPLVKLGVVGSYSDLDIESGQGYFYEVCSYDLGGNQHLCSEEIFVRGGEDHPLFLPVVLKR